MRKKELLLAGLLAAAGVFGDRHAQAASQYG